MLERISDSGIKPFPTNIKLPPIDLERAKIIWNNVQNGLTTVEANLSSDNTEIRRIAKALFVKEV